MVTYTALPTEVVRAYQRGDPDAYGNPPERAVSDGQGNPCRHCLREIPEGKEMLILAHKPFEGAHPYAELGPIFLCAEQCGSGTSKEIPEILTTSPDYLIKGYSVDDRIVYGTGAVIPAKKIPSRVSEIFTDARVSYVHVRSARNNCYQLRIDRDGS